MRVAIATLAAMPPEFRDDEVLADELRRLGAEAERIAWDEPAADWGSFGAVVIRSTWDYTSRREEFVEWADRVGERLHNSPAVVRWNSDKAYLGELGAAGLPVVATAFAAPGGEIPSLAGEVVVKPTVSAGGRDTGRFGPGAHDQARALIASIQAQGKTAMVQPYLRSVDELGETAIVCLDGEPSHVLRKGAVLRPDEVAPLRDDSLGAAEVMYDPGLVVAGKATDSERGLARDVMAHVAERFGYTPLYARVDMVPGDDGAPLLLELEAVEPNLYFDQAPGAAERVARAIIRRVKD